eukprot:14371801-Heterocapsa_arctica.AAC.1
MVPGGRTLSVDATGKAGISKKMRLHCCQFVTNPTHHPNMFGRVYVTHKAMKLAVTLGRPF